MREMRCFLFELYSLRAESSRFRTACFVALGATLAEQAACASLESQLSDSAFLLICAAASRRCGSCQISPSALKHKDAERPNGHSAYLAQKERFSRNARRFVARALFLSSRFSSIHSELRSLSKSSLSLSQNNSQLFSSAPSLAGKPSLEFKSPSK